MTTQTHPNSRSTPSYDAAAQAIVSHAVSQLRSIQAAGEHIGDPVDFVDREIQQAYIDLERLNHERGNGAKSHGGKPA